MVVQLTNIRSASKRTLFAWWPAICVFPNCTCKSTVFLNNISELYSQLYFLTVFLKCISQMYFSSVFLKYISQVYFSNVFLKCISQVYFSSNFSSLFLKYISQVAYAISCSMHICATSLLHLLSTQRQSIIRTPPAFPYSTHPTYNTPCPVWLLESANWLPNLSQVYFPTTVFVPTTLGVLV